MYHMHELIQYCIALGMVVGLAEKFDVGRMRVNWRWRLHLELWISFYSVF